MDTPPPTPLERLDSLIDTHESVSQQMAAASERLRPTFELALTAARTAISECLQDETVQLQVQQQDSQLQQDVQVVGTLNAEGLLTATQAESELERIMRHPDYRLLRIARGLGAVSVAEAPQEKPAAVASQQSKSTARGAPGKRAAPAERHESTKEKVTVEITPEATLINGKAYPDTIHGDFKDRRIGLLRGIRKLRTSKEADVYALWEMSFPGVAMDKAAFNVMKQWMDKYLVTENGERVLLHNGKRGPSSAYKRNRNVDFELITPETGARPSALGESAKKLLTAQVENYKQTPTLEEMRLLRIAVSEMAAQLDFPFDTSSLDPSILQDPDLSAHSDKEVGELCALTKLRIKAIAMCQGSNMDVFRGLQQDNKLVLDFLDAITPVIKQLAPVIGLDKEVRGIIGGAFAKHRS